MGVYYMWVCPTRKEFFDPGNLPNGPEGSGGYGIKYGSIPYSAWGVAVLALGRWADHDMRLVSDAGDGLYDEACDPALGYVDVTPNVLQDGLSGDLIPEEALRFLVDEACDNAPSKEASPKDLKAALLKKFGWTCP